MKKWRITTRIKDGIRDIEGETALAAFKERGFDIEELNVGQVFYVTGPYEFVLSLCESGYLVNRKLYNFALEEIPEPAPEEGGLDHEELDALEAEVDAEFERTDNDQE